MQQSKSSVSVARCVSCGSSLIGKFAIKSHQCRAPRISRNDAMALQRKARQHG